MRGRTGALLATLLVAAALPAQELLTLPMALHRAGTSSYQAELAGWARRAAQGDREEVGAAFLPELHFKGGHLDLDRDVAQRTAGQFTEIHASPLNRAHATAQEVAHSNPQAGPVQTEPALRPMALGDHEGEEVTPERSDALNAQLALRPKEPLPGVGRLSGQPGDSFNAWKGPLIAHIERQWARFQPGDRILNVTHYRDVQALKAWEKAGFPRNRGVDIGEMVQKGEQKPGDLYRLDPHMGAITEAPDASQDGIYFLRHGETEANNTNAAVPRELQAGGQ